MHLHSRTFSSPLDTPQWHGQMYDTCNGGWLVIGQGYDLASLDNDDGIEVPNIVLTVL